MIFIAMDVNDPFRIGGAVPVGDHFNGPLQVKGILLPQHGFKGRFVMFPVRFHNALEIWMGSKPEGNTRCLKRRSSEPCPGKR
jgi:hypothetical protein